MDIIDRIQAIKDADEDFWRNPNALKAALMVWRPECHVNDHGIFSPCPREEVARAGRATAKVGVCRVRDHCYVFCTGVQTSNYGYSYAASIWSAQPFATEDDARRAGIAEIIDRTQRKGGLSHAESVEMDGLRKALRGKTAQPSLF